MKTCYIDICENNRLSGQFLFFLDFDIGMTMVSRHLSGKTLFNHI